MKILDNMSRRDLFTKYGPATLFLMAALRSERGLALARRGRYIAMHTGHGFYRGALCPSGNSRALTSAMLAPTNISPLIPFMDNVTVLRGVSIGRDGAYATGDSYGRVGNTHDSGAVWFGTGCDPTDEGQGNAGNSGKYALCASFDEIVARRRGEGSKLVTQIGYPSNFNTNRPQIQISYNASGQANGTLRTPRDMFRKIFGTTGNSLFSKCPMGAPPATTAPVAKPGAQKSMLDANLAEFNAMIASKRLGNAEKDLLKKMVDQLRSLEVISDSTAAPGSATVATDTELSAFCDRMTATQFQANGQAPGNSKVTENSDLFFDIITLAFILDLADSATLGFGTGDGVSQGYGGLPYVVNGQNYFTEEGVDLHLASHIIGKTNEQRNAQLGAIDKFHAQRVAALAGKLKSFSLGAGTLLDETVILWGSDISGRDDMEIHTSDDTPHIIIGGKGLTNMPSGQLLTSGNMPSNCRIFTALASRFELPESAISIPEFRKPALF